MKFSVECLGETHDVFIKRGQLGFAFHTVRELEFLARMGERPGCLDVLEAFRGSRKSITETAPWAQAAWLCAIKSIKRRGKALESKTHRPRAADLAENRPAALADERMESAVKELADRIRASGLEAGHPVGWLRLGFRSKIKGKQVEVAEIDLGRGASLAIFFTWRWFADVYRRELSLAENRLVLGWDGSPIVLWLPNGTARLEENRVSPMEPEWRSHLWLHLDDPRGRTELESPGGIDFALDFWLPWGQTLPLELGLPLGSRNALPAERVLPWATVKLTWFRG